MDCHQCGAEIPEAQNVCPMCYAAVRKPGLLSRLLSSLFGSRGHVSSDARFNPTATTHRTVRRAEHIEVVDENGRKRVYSSLDEAPPEIREQIEAARAQAAPATTQHTFTIRDASGHEQTYHSLDEMPPEVRAVYERVLKERGLNR